MLELLLTEYQQNPWAVYMFWGLSVFYVILITPLIVGFLRTPNQPPRLLDDSELPMVTVLVSARNEEQDFPDCIASVRALDYPVEKLQIILVDDNSDDSTGRLVDEIAAADERVLALHSRDMPPTRLQAKARGIFWGMKHATGEWVFITDADARVPATWLRHMLSHARPDTGMLGGALYVMDTGWVSRFERASWAFTQMFNLGLSGLCIPFACLGPNMAIKRSIYEEAGGLENVDFSIAEDLALMKMVVHHKAGIINVVSAETVAALRPVPSYKHLLSQQRRWFRGGIDNEVEYQLFLWIFFGYAVVYGLFMLFGWIFSLPFFLLFHAVNVVVDLSYFYLQKKRFGLSEHLRYAFWAHAHKVIIFLLLTPSFLMTRRARWMGDGYEEVYD